MCGLHMTQPHIVHNYNSQQQTQKMHFHPHTVHCSEEHLLEGHLLALISPARVESSMSCKTSTRVAQVTGCLPFPVNHSWRISVFIRSASFRCLCAIILTLDPFLSSRRKVPNCTYLVAISTGILITLPSVHVKFK